jgi:hypothetical protein
VEWSGVEWSGVEWSGVEWSGVEWSGVEWSGVEWSGVDWSGVDLCAVTQAHAGRDQTLLGALHAGTLTSPPRDPPLHTTNLFSDSDIKANLGVEAGTDGCTALCQAVQRRQRTAHTIQSICYLRDMTEMGGVCMCLLEEY